MGWGHSVSKTHLELGVAVGKAQARLAAGWPCMQHARWDARLLPAFTPNLVAASAPGWAGVG